MASLVEELINVLTEEEKVYRTLAANGEKKRQIIIDADIPALEAITDLDQQAGDELLIMSNKQVSLLTDIANVLGKSDEKMTVTRLLAPLLFQMKRHICLFVLCFCLCHIFWDTISNFRIYSYFSF